MRISDWSSDVCSSDLDLHAQAGAMGVVGALRPEGPPDERIPRQIFRPGLAERTGERQQNGAPCERDRRVVPPHGTPTGVHDENPRPQRRFNLLKPQQPLMARSEEHTSELKSLMRISYAVFCLKKKNHKSQALITYNSSRIDHKSTHLITSLTT